ncbi:MAG: LytTR family DNA-binding domain-containing protein [Bacteroidota bacterium]
MKAIAIDDEPMALKVIERFAQKIPSLELQATFQNPIEALAYLQQHPVDLLFLDIQMPDLTGLQFLQSISPAPMVIFTTAYSEYALDSYEFDAVDYLLKPIAFERFLKAVNKASRLHQASQEGQTVTSAGDADDPLSESLFIKSDTRIFKVDRQDMLFIEGMRDYIAIHTPKQRIMTLMSLSKMLDKLPPTEFIRVHKSYIVGVRHIRLIQHNRIFITEHEIPISNTYKEAFFDLIEKLQ